LSKKELKEANEPLQGNFEGIGIQFNILNDTIVVVSPIPGGPSEKLGIMAGDKIVKIEGKNVAGIGITNSQVIKTLRGPKGTKVNVTIYRKGKLIDFTIVRDKIPIYSVDASYMIDDEVGYIKLNRFAQTSIRELEEAIKKLQAKGMKRIILDLTGNVGGYLHVAVQLADEFLDEGKLIVYTEGLHSPRQEFRSTARGLLEKGKVVIMVDEGSASASEIVSGAIQDWDRGILVGRRTFGKGLVQKTFSLPDGSAIRLTTARYYTPSGRSIQRPYNKGVKEYYKEITKRFQHGELIHADSIKFPDSLKYYTKNGRVVYGGGGIMPDFFVPLDTTHNSKLYTDILRKGLINEFVLQYMDQHREELKSQYPNKETFKERFNVEGSLWNQLIEYVQQNNVEVKEDHLKKSGPTLKVILKAVVARNLFDISAYYYIINEINPIFLKSKEIIKNDKIFKKLKIND
jgi:carboxyl-terminal processing protease